MIPLLLLQVILIALNAIFASAEIAVLSINETKLQKMSDEGSKKAKRLWKLTREPAKFLATIQVAITLSGFLGSAFAADNFSEPLVAWVVSLNEKAFAGKEAMLDKIAVIIITLILSYFTLIFGELVPKRLAMKKSEKVAMGISGLVSTISVIFKPIVWFLSVSTNLVLRLCGIDPNEVEDEVSEEEIRMMVDAGSEKGTIDHQEKEFIQNVFEFNDITAEDIATHRKDVTVLWLEDDISVWAETINKSRHTFFPVCDGLTDNIYGILNSKDYFRLEDRSRESILENTVHPAYFVPISMKADVLFRNMKDGCSQMAIVIDEYGGMVGIVTLHDLIEELVGEIGSESEDESSPSPSIAEVAEYTWEINGNIRLSEIEDVTGLELENEDYDTLTGLVFDKLGYIPDDGDALIEMDQPNFELKITSVVAHQVEKCILILKNFTQEDIE